MDNEIGKIFNASVDEEKLAATISNMSKMAERMEKGLKLVYPEEQQAYLDFLLKNAAISYNGDYIDNALEIMQALEDGASVEEAYKLIHVTDIIGYNSAVQKLVLLWSKRGPEFFAKTLQCDIKLLSDEEKKEICDVINRKSLYKFKEAYTSNNELYKFNERFTSKNKSR